MAEQDMKKKGSKQEVFEGKAYCTAGGLKKDDLILNKRGQIVSKKRSEQGKKQFKNLENFKKNKEDKEDKEAGEHKEDKESEEEENNNEQAINEKKNEKIMEKQGINVENPYPAQQNEVKPVQEEVKIGDQNEIKEEKIDQSPIVKIPKAPVKKENSKKKSKIVTA